MIISSVGLGIRKLFGGKDKRRGRNPKVAVNAKEAKLLAAARRGNVDAQIRLATAYAEGDGMTQDYGEAAHWYGEAARRGNASAPFRFGICHAHGQGTAQDSQAAVEWFRRLAG
jgi:TPR repeat protein